MQVPVKFLVAATLAIAAYCLDGKKIEGAQVRNAGASGHEETVPKSAPVFERTRPARETRQIAAIEMPARVGLRDEVGSDVFDDVSEIVRAEKREREFLLRELKLTPEKYQAIEQQRRVVHLQLKNLDAWSASLGVSREELRQSILTSHVAWMKTQIGVGNYQRLQNLEVEEL